RVFPVPRAARCEKDGCAEFARIMPEVASGEVNHGRREQRALADRRDSVRDAVSDLGTGECGRSVLPARGEALWLESRMVFGAGFGGAAGRRTEQSAARVAAGSDRCTPGDDRGRRDGGSRLCGAEPCKLGGSISGDFYRDGGWD